MDKSGRLRVRRRNGKRSGRMKNPQAKWNGKAKDGKHKAGTESGGGTGNCSNKAEGKGEARTGIESVRHD